MKTTKTLLLSLLAITFSIAALSQNPGSAQIFLDEGNLLKAKEAIDKAMANEKHTAKAKTWVVRGKIYASIANDQTGLYKNLDANADEVAAESFNKALEIEPANKDAKEAMKISLFPAFLNGAINAFNEARKIDDEDSPETKKLYEKALKKCQLAEQINAEDTLVHIIMVTCAYPLKDMEAVKKSSEKLVNIPNFNGKDFYYQVLAFHYRDVEKNNAKAIEYAQAGLKANPNDKNMQGLLLDLYIKENKIDEAVADVKKQVEANPNDAAAHFRLGVLYEKLNKPDEALKSYEKSVALDPTFDAVYNLGAMYYNKGAEILKVVNAMPLDEYNKKGKAEEDKANKEFELALPYFEKLYKMEPTNMQVLGPLGNIYTRLGKKEQADKIGKEIQKLDKE